MIPGLSLRAGDLLAGHYRVTSLLRADRACAYLAATPTKKGASPVEVQLLLAMDDGADAVRLRFLVEGRKIATLRAPGVLEVLEVGITSDGHPFLVRETPAGESLAALLARQGSLPTEHAVDVAVDLCEALAAAHARGIVHGELSPSAIRLTSSLDGPTDVKVVDLGVSRALAMLPLDARARESFAISAPELLRSSREPDERADIWGVGVLLHTMLAGAAPYAFESPSTVDLSVARDEPAMLAGVPDGLADVVDACLAREPALRPATMQLLASKLAEFGARRASAKQTSLTVVDTGPYEALVLDALVKEAAAPSPSEPKAVPDDTPEPLSFSVSPPMPVRATTEPRTPPSRTSRTIAIVGIACAAAGLVVVGLASTRHSATVTAGAGLVQAAAPLAETAVPRVDPPPPAIASTMAAEPAAVTDLRPLVPAPHDRAASPAPKTTTAPAGRPLVRSAAAPIHPVPKASDDDLRRFLDDRR